MTHTVVVNQFEGPLGLLLELVEQGQFEVTSISVARITHDYVEQIKQLTNLSPDEVGEFAGLGARLVYIKSLALLPQAAASEQAEELHQLNLELQDYIAIKQAAATLAQQPHSVWARPTQPSNHIPKPTQFPAVTLAQLAEACTQALTRIQPVLPTAPALTPHISLQAVAGRLKQAIAAGPLPLDDLLRHCTTRLEVIVTFMAALELIHDHTIRVQQSSQFAPITLESVHA